MRLFLIIRESGTIVIATVWRADLRGERIARGVYRALYAASLLLRTRGIS